jgi:hypothetical protein
MSYRRVKLALRNAAVVLSDSTLPRIILGAIGVTDRRAAGDQAGLPE